MDAGMGVGTGVAPWILKIDVFITFWQKMFLS